jgi:hypothetical protein
MGRLYLDQELDAKGDRRVDGAFLGAGTSLVDLQTWVELELTIAPWARSLGGGGCQLLERPRRRRLASVH